MFTSFRARLFLFLALLAGIAAFITNIDLIAKTITGSTVSPYIAKLLFHAEPIGFVLIAEAEIDLRNPQGDRGGGSWSIDQPKPSLVQSNFNELLPKGGYASISFKRAKELNEGDIIIVNADNLPVINAEDVTAWYKYKRSRYFHLREPFVPSGFRYKGDCLKVMVKPTNYINRTVYLDDPLFNAVWARVADETCPK